MSAGNKTIGASKKLQSSELLCGFFCPRCGASCTAFLFFHCKEGMEDNLRQKNPRFRRAPVSSLKCPMPLS